MLGGGVARGWVMAIVAGGCAAHGGREPLTVQPEEEAARPAVVVQPIEAAAEVVPPEEEAGPAEVVPPEEARPEEPGALEREAAGLVDREAEKAQELARRMFGCHPHRAARLRFATGSAELDAGGRAAVDRLVRRLQDEPGAQMIVLGAMRAGEGRELAGLDWRRAEAVREALLARGVPPRQVVAAADFRAAARRAEVEVLWVCDVCCLL